MKTYKEQFDKMTQAYIKDEVNPYSFCACFIGNLLDGRDGWKKCRESYNFSRGDYNSINNFTDLGDWDGYTSREIVELEKVFMGMMYKKFTKEGKNKPETKEDALFEAFEVTLERLKEIHISKGEVIDQVSVFVKREKPVEIL